MKNSNTGVEFENVFEDMLRELKFRPTTEYRIHQRSRNEGHDNRLLYCKQPTFVGFDGRERKADFGIVINSPKNGRMKRFACLVECRSQTVGGTTEDKILFSICDLHSNDSFGKFGLIVLDGDGFNFDKLAGLENLCETKRLNCVDLSASNKEVRMVSSDGVREFLQKMI